MEKIEAQLPTAARPGIPVQLSIPSIDLSLPIDPLGLLPDGKLDAPAEPFRLGWYRLNARPGEEGNAVLDGHLNLHGAPAAFANLHQVVVGEEIEVTDEEGVTRLFRVMKTEVYHVDHAPMEEIFGNTDGKHLNLITCAGVWREEMNHYDQRLVVYTELIES